MATRNGVKLYGIEGISPLLLVNVEAKPIPVLLASYPDQRKTAGPGRLQSPVVQPRANVSPDAGLADPLQELRPDRTA